jgi:polygalacturonase
MILRSAIRQVNDGNGISGADEGREDTQRIQKAIDGCPPGQAVELSPNGDRQAFLIGPISMRGGVTLLLDRAVTVYASRWRADYDILPGSCGVLTHVSTAGCRPLISGSGIANAAIMGEGTIDGRGGSPVLGQDGEPGASWWDMASVSGNGMLKHNPRMIDFENAHDIVIYKTHLRNAAGFHVAFRLGRGLTIWGATLDTPYRAKNSDGIDPMGSSDVTIANSFIRTGDDNIAIKGDNGRPSSHISILDSHLYWGHGLSIGSGTYPAITSVLTRNVTFDGTLLAAIRIKSGVSNGGVVSNIVYDHVCIRNSERPIEIESDYSDADNTRTDRVPVYQGILLHDVVISGGGKIRVAGNDEDHPADLRLSGVLVTDAVDDYHVSTRFAHIHLGPEPVALSLSGQGVQVDGVRDGAAPARCSIAFVPFPVTAS